MAHQAEHHYRPGQHDTPTVLVMHAQWRAGRRHSLQQALQWVHTLQPTGCAPKISTRFSQSLSTRIAGQHQCRGATSGGLWPGLGLLVYQALRVPDLPLLQGTFVVICAAVIVMNTLADLLLQVLDPRVRW